jgi:two-component system capsular synthesis sensor histidine kinase RcsC
MKDQARTYVLRTVEVSRLIESVVENTAELVQASGFVLEQQIEPALPPIQGDLVALSQCLQNLIVNAVKYSGESRWIGLRAFLAEAEDRRRKEIRISVEDRGIGIQPSEIPQIFHPFYRSPSVRSAQIHGTGLGLPLASSIAEAMGGSLSVVSEPEVGSVFTLHLPVAAPETFQAAAASATERVTQK